MPGALLAAGVGIYIYILKGQKASTNYGQFS